MSWRPERGTIPVVEPEREHEADGTPPPQLAPLAEAAADLPTAGTTTELARSVEHTSGMRGFHAGVIVFAGIASANAGNAVFHLIAARWLGPSAYGDLASLLALAGLIGFPLAGAQLALAQYVAHFRAKGNPRAVGGLYWRSLTAAGALGVVLMLVLAALSVPLQRALGIDSLAAILLLALLTVPAVVTPVIWGVAQGLERFVLFSLIQVAGPILRILALVPLLFLGFGVAGAMGAGLVAALAAILIPLWYLRRWLIVGVGQAAPVTTREARRLLVPVVAGLLAITSLSSVDLVVAKIVFSDHDAGLYGSASLIGRLILYLPAAIVAVVLPKVSSRAAVGRETSDILTKSLLATGALCLVAVALYATVPRLVVGVAFGSKYEGAIDLLWLFGVAMTGFALLNVLFVYHLGRRTYGVSWLLCGGAVVQIAAFALFHDSPQQLLVVSIVVAYALLGVYGLVLHRRVSAGAQS